ncbi:hypothetical protein [Marinobacter halodurans]|uniref:hypothetical protein n=1 Tax=Marinobacter halodurans TaxID=2528979 RepID=UPI001A955A61|nr:hypothetical protein [Marinobacter halodurans]
MDKFLDDYLEEMNGKGFEEKEYRKRFGDVLDFVGLYFPIGFKKSQNDNSVPRIRFEAISVGVHLALRCRQDFVPEGIGAWITGKEFGQLTRSDASNSRPKVINRIHFVRDNLLGKEVEYEGDKDKIFHDPRHIDSDQADFFGEV